MIMMVSKMMTTMLVVNADGDEWLVVTYDKGWQRVAGLSVGLDLASGWGVSRAMIRGSAPPTSAV